MASRNLAFKVLLQVERSDAYLNIALDAALRSAGSFSRQDAALATELSYGVTRRRLTLDHALAAQSSRPIKKLETAVLIALRIGAYQLLFLDRIPDYAAVGGSVNLVKQQGLERAAGFVNAVLRKLAQCRQISWPSDPWDRLAVEESHPLWLVRRWSNRWGLEEAQALCRANNEAPPVCVRVSHRATREEVMAMLAKDGVCSRPTRYSPLGLLLENPGPISKLHAFQQGQFQVQDEAAQLVSWLAAARPGMRVLDACAAPGAKTCHLAEQLEGKGEVVAVDIHPRKLEKLMTEAQRLKVEKTIHPQAADSSGALPFPERSFDLAVLDCPCSGLGTLRRHPELRYRRQEEDISRLAKVQSSLVANVWRYVKPGGTLIYSVCSTEPEEGPAVIEKLVQSVGVEQVPLDTTGGSQGNELRDPQGALACFPHRHHMDGFYAARLKIS